MVKNWGGYYYGSEGIEFRDTPAVLFLLVVKGALA